MTGLVYTHERGLGVSKIDLLHTPEVIYNDLSYPFTIPPAVEEYLDHVLTIPDGILGAYLPSSNLPVPVKTFIQQTFRSLKSKDLLLIIAPNQETFSIITYPVPSEAFILSLRSVLGQALLDGNWLKKGATTKTGSATTFEAALQRLDKMAVNASLRGPTGSSLGPLRSNVTLG
ncbi:hypothetical protein EV363DRAFT_1104950, partial [Boletus edulis]